MEKIENIIASSIRVKQDILQDETLLKTVKECIAVIVHAFKNGNKVLFAVMAATLPMPNTWLPNSADGFIPTGMHYLPKRSIVTLLT